MKKILSKRNIFILVVLFLGIAQLFPVEKENPIVSSDLDFIAVEHPPKKIGQMLKGQCYDCHSNETKYPWYFDYAPVSWWLKSNVNGAREELNFSDWANYSDKSKVSKLQLCVEMLEEGEMPVGLYVAMHEEAQFSEEDEDSLLNYFKSK